MRILDRVNVRNERVARRRQKSAHAPIDRFHNTSYAAASRLHDLDPPSTWDSRRLASQAIDFLRFASCCNGDKDFTTSGLVLA